MKDFFEYLNSGTVDKKWGVSLTVAGKYTSPPGESYPGREHPTGYYFNWNSWRVLNEFQLNLITEGSGVLELDYDRFELKPGTVMLIRPGQRHRYKPNSKTGWTENYIGFRGDLATHFVDQVFEKKSNPCVHCSHPFELMDSFQRIFGMIQQQSPSFQKIGAGLVIQLLGNIESQILQEQFRGKEVESLVNNAKQYIWDHVDEGVDFKGFAALHHVSYSYFRKIFKIYTGLAPHQYFLDSKILRAKELILTSDLPIKEISYRLGFSSIHYFSRIFKNKMGQSPREVRF